MRRNDLAKHGWSVISGALLCFCGAPAAHAAPGGSAQIAIGNPLANALVGGQISMSVAYDMGPTNIGAFAVFVDDTLQYSRPFITINRHGIQYLDLDTRQLADGNHTVKITAMGPRGALASDVINITVRNGIPGGPDLVPPLVQFRGLQDGDVVSGKIAIDVLAEDNVTRDLLVSIFVNQNVSLLKNRAPYVLELDTAQYLDPATNTGKIRLEAWAYDKAENLGKARPITLTVVPAGAALNQTRRQGDPTLPAISRPTLPTPEMRSGLEPVKTPMEGSIVVPLGPREQMPSRRSEPVPPAAVSARLEGHPRITPSEAIPAGRLAHPRMAKNVTPAIDPDFAPVGSAAQGGLAGGKVSVPYAAPRPNSRPSRAQGRSVDPIPAVANPAPTLAGSRATAPTLRVPAAQPTVARVPRPAPAAPTGVTAAAGQAGRASRTPTGGDLRLTLPAPQRVASATIRPNNPEIVPARPSAGIQPAPAVNEGQVHIGLGLPAPSKMGAENPMPVPAVNPMPSPGGPRIEIPSVPPNRLEKAAASSHPKTGAVIVAVVPKDAKPNKDGRVPAQVYRIHGPAASGIAALPRDREYRLTRGETLESVAKRFKVSSRSLMVANGFDHTHTLRAGSIVKVPGSFDVALNGQNVRFDVTPRVENGVPLAPFRQIFEHAGGTVVWYPDTQEVHAANDTKDIKLKVGSKEAVVNQMVVVMDRAAFVESGRTIVPISFMEKALDLQAEFDVKSGTIILARR